jgi:hypothetical protein
VWATVFGAVVAGGTIVLARRSVVREAPGVEGQVPRVELEPGSMTALDAPELHGEARSPASRSAQNE